MNTTIPRELESDLLSISQFCRLAKINLSKGHYLRLKGLLPVRKLAGHYVIVRQDAERVVERLRLATDEMKRDDTPLARTPDLLGPGRR